MSTCTYQHIYKKSLNVYVYTARRDRERIEIFSALKFQLSLYDLPIRILRYAGDVYVDTCRRSRKRRAETDDRRSQVSSRICGRMSSAPTAIGSFFFIVQKFHPNNDAHDKKCDVRPAACVANQYLGL